MDKAGVTYDELLFSLCEVSKTISKIGFTYEEWEHAINALRNYRRVSLKDGTKRTISNEIYYDYEKTYNKPEEDNLETFNDKMMVLEL